MATQIDRLGGAKGALAYKAPCRVTTTANITLSGLQTVDGVVLVTGDRVLVKDQDTDSENGIWVVANGSWSRAKDFDGNTDAVQGTRVDVTGGAVGSGEYKLTSSNPVYIGTSSIAFEITDNARGPASAVAGNLASFDDTTGKVLADSGLAITTILTTDVVGSTGTNGVQPSFSRASYDLGTYATTVAITLASSNGMMQHMINNAGSTGSLPLSGPASNGMTILEVTNGTSPATITTTAYGNYVAGAPSTGASAISLARIWKTQTITFLEWLSS